MDGDCVGTGETRGNQSRGKRDEGLRRCFGGRRRQAKDAGKKPCCFFFFVFFWFIQREESRTREPAKWRK